MTAKPPTTGFALRFTIGQMMLVVTLAGLALAPVAMYRQKAAVELIVATVAFETIGLPALMILVLIASMEPGPARTRRIVLLSLAPTLLIAGAFGLAEVVGLSYGIYDSFIRTGRPPVHPSTLVLLFVQFVVVRRLCAPPRCPACRAVKLRRDMPGAISRERRSTESLTCKKCGARAQRTTYWGYPGRLRAEAASPAPPEVQFVETHEP